MARQGRWVVYRLPGDTSRASLATSWSVAGSSEDALTAILDPGFRSADRAIVEGRPAFEPSTATVPAGAGSAAYRSTGPQSAVVSVDAPRPAIVVIRTVYDKDWRATVDGHPVHILPTDYLVQGVPVPAGRHTVRVWYHDPTIGPGSSERWSRWPFCSEPPRSSASGGVLPASRSRWHQAPLMANQGPYNRPALAAAERIGLVGPASAPNEHAVTMP